MKKTSARTVPIILCLLFTFITAGVSSIIPFRILESEEITRYYEDRIVYQQYEKQPADFTFSPIDNSIASLMVIMKKRVYLIKDGYDNEKEVLQTKKNYELAHVQYGDLWTNKIDGNPDFVRITDRRVEVTKNTVPEYVTKTYKDFYIKVRNEFLTRHVNIFKSIMVQRIENGITVERKPIPRQGFQDVVQKYSISVTGKGPDDSTYYAEDADGDGITETFTVNLYDGFCWGFKSGPNIVFIYNNRQKDIEAMIGKLTDFAINGTPEEKGMFSKNFPSPDVISGLINDIYRIDPDAQKLMQDNRSTDAK